MCNNEFIFLTGIARSRFSCTICFFFWDNRYPIIEAYTLWLLVVFNTFKENSKIYFFPFIPWHLFLTFMWKNKCIIILMIIIWKREEKIPSMSWTHNIYLNHMAWKSFPQQNWNYIMAHCLVDLVNLQRHY